MFISPRMLRTAATISMTSAISASAPASGQRSSLTGKGEIASGRPPPGSRSAISSVTNGMIGCISASTRRSTKTAVPRAASPEASAAPRRGLTISRYQSQNSCHVNW